MTHRSINTLFRFRTNIFLMGVPSSSSLSPVICPNSIHIYHRSFGTQKFSSLSHSSSLSSYRPAFALSTSSLIRASVRACPTPFLRLHESFSRTPTSTVLFSTSSTPPPSSSSSAPSQLSHHQTFSTTTATSSIFGVPSSSPSSSTVELNSWGIPKGSLLDKIKYAVREYGKTALVIYGTLWIVPFVSTYGICQSTQNFHTDPVELLDWIIGIENRIKIWEYCQLPVNEPLNDKTVSLLYAYLASELIETPRLLLTLFLAPKVKRYVTGRSRSSTSSKLM